MKDDRTGKENFMEKPSLSVIMPVKNGERYLEEAIRSILVQDIKPYEILLVDGDSTDRTLHIASEFKEITIVSQHGKGISNAYNQGIQASSGEYIAFISSDDIWLPDKLTIQMKYMMSNPDVWYTNGHITYKVESQLPSVHTYRKEWLQGSLPAKIMETLVAKRSVFERVGAFDENLSTAEDVDWYTRAQRMELKSAMLPHNLLIKRIHDQNHSLNVEMNNMNLLKTIRKNLLHKCYSPDGK
ncbi:MAG TPA: glycosyltransferase [Saprospiraceae bacterium]|nr:glycosyltransferase [Saprospiraceae bacterium]